MKRLFAIITTMIPLALLFMVNASFAAPTAVSIAEMSLVSLPTMTAYCQAPPLKVSISPNIMLTVDVSGSMSWPAYYPDTYTNAQRDAHYNPGTQYEGYFDPSKNYALNASNIYEEIVYTGIPCHNTTCNTWGCYSQPRSDGTCSASGTHGCTGNKKKNPCCDGWNTAGDCNVGTSGNYLNYVEMARIDLIRWAVTGGRPASCASNPNDGAYCDPEVWKDSGNSTKVGSVCNDSLDVNGDGVAEGGCILQLDNGDKVKVRWERIVGTNLVTGVTSTNGKYGLVYQFAAMAVKPRLGALFFESNGVRANKVYIGDFNASGTKTSYLYYNLITQVNSQDPGGSTPTGPAMWDTFNYFAQKAPQYGGFSVQTGSSDKWKNPMYNCDSGGTNCLFIPCAENDVILLSDGQWNQGGNPGSVTSTCSIDTGSPNSADPVVPAYKMHQSFLNTAASVTTYVRSVYTIGLFMNGGSGQLAMENIAMYGSFLKDSNTWPDSKTDYPRTTCTAVDCSGTAKGSACTALPASSSDWDSDGMGVPDTFYSGNDANQIQAALLGAVLDIMAQTNAGTAASVLASREGKGANLLQAVYYPKKTFTNQSVSWVGSMQNMWYYIDPTFTNTNIREDGRDADGVTHDFIMNLQTTGTQKDYITQFYFDTGSQAAMANRWTDSNGDASIVGETQLSPIKVDAIANLWEAGQQLWSRSWTTRTVYTSNVTGSATTNNMLAFACSAPGSCSNVSTLKPYLNATDASGTLNNDVASTIMQWTLGYDTPTSSLSGPTYTPSYRSRQAQLGTLTNAWKLGDIINSTPKISTWQPQGDYHLWFNDVTYGPLNTVVYQSDPVDTSTYVTGYQYKGRGMVYTGSNDGMLHAFRLGLLQTKWPGQGKYQMARLTNNVCSISKNIFCGSDSQCPGGETCSSTVTLGDEAWAFIPKNALPYLKYMADPTYCHVYAVDLTPYIFDASIGRPSGCSSGTGVNDCTRAADSWRTVLIGGMRLGGACRRPTQVCTTCVNAPINDPANANKGLGYSSYFALDITNQSNPVLLWEYDGTVNSGGTYINKLGFALSGPAVARVNSPAPVALSDAQNRNGNWFVVFGSGPTGPIDAYQQFLGQSDQNLTLHVFDLAAGPGTDNANVTIIDTGLTNAFAGNMTATSFDVTKDYSDEVVYVPYTQNTTDGGLGRLVIQGLNPANWQWSKVIANTGPMTAAPSLLQYNGDIWLLFGTGRYFYDTATSTDDANPAMQRQLFGMKEQCLNTNKDAFQNPCPASATLTFCATPVGAATCGGLTNVDNISVANNLEATNAAVSTSYLGWYLDLDPALPTSAPTYYGERVITNPSADSSGIVYYTTFEPQNNPCSKFGQTFIWALKFDTGGSAVNLIQGNALIQLSTGSIQQLNLSSAFTLKDQRRTAGLTGQPPTGAGLTVMGAQPGASKPLFMKEM